MAETIKINENTWRIEDGDVRFYLFCGTEKAALIDSGMNVPEAREIAEGLTSLPLVMINTHGDPDHISGNDSFDEFYMSPAEEENYRGRGGKGKLLPLRHPGKMLRYSETRYVCTDSPMPGFFAKLSEAILGNENISRQEGKP